MPLFFPLECPFSSLQTAPGHRIFFLAIWRSFPPLEFDVRLLRLETATFTIILVGRRHDFIFQDWRLSMGSIIRASVVLCILSSITSAVSAQDRSTLDAEFPSVHSYKVEIWFMQSDKLGTFKYRIFDTSISGQYNSRAWEDFRTKMNDPNVRGVSRKIEVVTRAGVPETEREQIMLRIKQEKDRLEFQNLPTVDVKPLPGKTKKAEEQPRATGYAYDEKARKTVASLEGTKWTSSDGRTYEFSKEHLSQSYREKYGKYSDRAAANAKLLDHREVHRLNGDRGYTSAGVWNQVDNKVYRYDEFVTGRLEPSGVGVISNGKIVFDPFTYSDGSVSDKETWIQKK
jgi:hypothetical protein